MSTTYRNAKLVEGKSRWYILFYQTSPRTGNLTRFRQTYNINKIKNEEGRRVAAQRIITQINQKLPDGFPFKASLERLSDTMLLDALERAVNIKIASTNRKRTVDMVESMFRIFCEFVRKSNLEGMRISDFSKKDAIAFLDYGLVEREIGARTYNNYIERMRSMFTELVKREYLPANPFSCLGKMKEQGKRRRAFSEMERKTLIDAVVKKGDKMLLLGILLQYHCFIRPVELRRLRFEMFDFRKGVIRLPGEVTKNKENDTVTIPDDLLPFLYKMNFQKYNQRWLIFGKGVEPHPSKACNHNILNHRQHRIIKDLQKSGMFNANTDGLSFYSWKDTGAMELFSQKVNWLEIMKQLRHKSLTTTQKYCESLYEVNWEIKKLDNSLLSSEHLRMLD